MNVRSLLRLITFVGAIALSNTLGNARAAEEKHYASESDKRFEEALERLQTAGSSVQPIDPRMLPPATQKHRNRVASIKKSWQRSFRNSRNVVGLREKAPPPPNNTFRKAENGGLLKHVDKRKGNRSRGRQPKKRR